MSPQPVSESGHSRRSDGQQGFANVRYASISTGLMRRNEPTRCADFVAEVGDYYARGLPRFVDTSSYYAAFGER
jgi:hypothetical protein